MSYVHFCIKIYLIQYNAFLTLLCALLMFLEFQFHFLFLVMMEFNVECVFGTCIPIACLEQRVTQV